MIVLSLLGLLVGVFGLIGFFMQKHKAGRIGSTPLVSTADAASKGSSVAGEKGAIAVEGAIRCASPVVSPVTQTSCLYYHLTVTASWKVGDQSRSAEIQDEKVAATVSVDDGTGPVNLVITSPSDDELKESFSKSQKRGLMSVMSGNKLTFGDKGFSLIAGMDVPGHRIPDDAEYKVVERIIAPIERAYVAGKSENNQIIAPSWVSLMISSKGREGLLAGTATMLNRTKYAAIGGFAAAAVFGILAAVMG